MTGGSQNLDEYAKALAASVAKRDIARGAFCCKELLDGKYSTRKIKEALLQGLGHCTLDPRYAKAICMALSACSNRSRDQVRTAVARALVTCMKAVSGHQKRDSKRDVMIGSGAFAKALHAGDERKASAIAEAQMSIEGIGPTVTAFAKAAMVSDGADASAIEALVQSGLAKGVAPECIQGVQHLVLACVQAAFLADSHDVCVHAGVEEALCCKEPKQHVKRGEAKLASSMEEDDCDLGVAHEGDGAPEDIKLGAIWTYVKRDTYGKAHLSGACPGRTQDVSERRVIPRPTANSRQTAQHHSTHPVRRGNSCLEVTLPQIQPEYKVITGVRDEDMPSKHCGSIQVRRLDSKASLA